MRNPAKEYLEELSVLKLQIKSLEKEIKAIDERNTSVKAIVYDKLNVQTPYVNSLEEGVIEKIDIENSGRLEWLKQRYEVKKALILLQISAMEKPLHKKILLLKYDEGKSLHAIARELNYSKETIANEHGKALQEFKKKYFKEQS